MKSNEDPWAGQLTPEQYRIMRECGTEPAFSGKYWDHHEDGTYRCAACGSMLFSSETKFDSGTGWPSFTEPMDKENVELVPDDSLGMSGRAGSGFAGRRTEVRCKACGSHLGHVFPDGPGPTGERFCINSAALDFNSNT